MTTIDKSLPVLRILPHAAPFHLHRASPKASLVLSDIDKSEERDFISFTRTSEETSIVYAGSPQIIPGSEYEGPWGALRVTGPMPFHLTGILHALTEVLAKASIPIFALSTWNTDYVLVHEDKLKDAIKALKDDGWDVADRA